jgi:hypothetical protein
MLLRHIFVMTVPKNKIDRPTISRNVVLASLQCKSISFSSAHVLNIKLFKLFYYRTCFCFCFCFWRDQIDKWGAWLYKSCPPCSYSHSLEIVNHLLAGCKHLTSLFVFIFLCMHELNSFVWSIACMINRLRVESHQVFTTVILATSFYNVDLKY